MSRTFMAGGLLHAPFSSVDVGDFSIFSLHPTEDPALVVACSDLIRDITREEVEAGQNVLQPDEDLPNNRTALLTVAIAKTTGRLVGVLTSTRSSDGLTVLFGGLAIHRDYRRRGLAKKLVLCAVDDRVRFDGHCLHCFAYVRVRRQINHGSYLAFKAAGFFATRPVLKKRDALGPRAAHWDEETTKLLLITKNAGAMSTAEFDALCQEMV